MCRVLCVRASVHASRGRVWAVAHIMNVGMFIERNRFDMQLEQRLRIMHCTGNFPELCF